MDAGWECTVKARKLEHGFIIGGLVLGSLILYVKGMRIMMLQLSGFYYRRIGP